jgi:hypothetical protein
VTPSAAELAAERTGAPTALNAPGRDKKRRSYLPAVEPLEGRRLARGSTLDLPGLAVAHQSPTDPVALTEPPASGKPAVAALAEARRGDRRGPARADAGLHLPDLAQLSRYLGRSCSQAGIGPQRQDDCTQEVYLTLLEGWVLTARSGVPSFTRPSRGSSARETPPCSTLPSRGRPRRRSQSGGASRRRPSAMRRHASSTSSATACSRTAFLPHPESIAAGPVLHPVRASRDRDRGMIAGIMSWGSEQERRSRLARAGQGVRAGVGPCEPHVPPDLSFFTALCVRNCAPEAGKGGANPRRFLRSVSRVL